MTRHRWSKGFTSQDLDRMEAGYHSRPYQPEQRSHNPRHSHRGQLEVFDPDDQEFIRHQRIASERAENQRQRTEHRRRQEERARQLELEHQQRGLQRLHERQQREHANQRAEAERRQREADSRLRAQQSRYEQSRFYAGFGSEETIGSIASYHRVERPPPEYQVQDPYPYNPPHEQRRRRHWWPGGRK